MLVKLFHKILMMMLAGAVLATIMPQTPMEQWKSMSDNERKETTIEFRAEVAGMSEKEFRFLSAVVEAESDRNKSAESFENRVLIATVILNRVDSKKFPGTITKVLKQRGQFSVVRSGAYKRIGRTTLSDFAVIEAVRRRTEEGVPKILYFRTGHYFRGHKRYRHVGDNYFSY